MRLDTFIRNSRAMLENNMAFFSKKTDGGRKLRAKELTRRFVKVSRNPQGQAVTEWKVPSASDPGKEYDCYISVEPKQGTLFTIAHAKGNLRTRVQLIKDADVRCFCTCPDFNWSGMKYNMKHRFDGYEDGHSSVDGVPDGSDIRPKVKDPRGKRTVCKHLLTCFTGMLTGAQVIMKAARTTKFPQEYTKEPEDVKVLNPETDKEASSGEITQMNGGKGKETASGEIKANNTGTDRKPLADYPKEDEAIKVLGESAPVKLPEAQAALDALAGTLGEPDAGVQEDSGEITAVGQGETGEAPGEEEISMFNGDSSPDLSDPLTGIEDASKLPIFNLDDEEDENT